MANRWGINGNSDRLYFLGLQNDCGWWLQPKQSGFSPTSRLKQLWEVLCHNWKMFQAASLLQCHSSKASILWCSAFFTVQLSRPYMTTGKTIALARQTFVGKVMSLLFNTLSRFAIAFLSKELASFRFMAAVTIHSDFETQENKVCHCFHLLPVCLPCGGGLVAKSCPTLATTWTVACQAPLFMGFSRQDHWNAFPSSGDLSNLGTEPRSPALQADSLLT